MLLFAHSYGDRNVNFAVQKFKTSNSIIANFCEKVISRKEEIGGVVESPAKEKGGENDRAYKTDHV